MDEQVHPRPSRDDVDAAGDRLDVGEQDAFRLIGRLALVTGGGDVSAGG
ncbi:hypothetical protein [Nonomuraea wenchangensis]